LEEIFEICDRVTVLRDGRHIATNDTGAIDRDGLIRLMVGRDLSKTYPSKEPVGGEPVKISSRSTSSGSK
jgi:ABC-type sugar transport system ATPase subunit